MTGGAPAISLGLLGNAVFVLAARALGLAVLSGVVTAAAAFLFRQYGGEPLPEGPALLLGMGSVAVYLNTRVALVQFLGGGGEPLTVSAAASNLVVFVAAGMAALSGRRVGHDVAESDRFGADRLRSDLSPLVRATGRSITVSLPAEIPDIEGYDPVPDETKDRLEGTAFHFPRGLTVDELEADLVTRLKVSFEVGAVDVDLAADGTVKYLAVGRRAAGLGSTLPPGYEATAVTADPPRGATPGDTVQLWRDGELVTRAELRATAGRVVTVVGVEGGFDDVEPEATYRLVTLPADSRPDREFAAALRRADQTTGAIRVESDGDLAGRTVGETPGTIVAIRSGDDDLETVPERSRVLRAGDVVYVIGLPATLRSLTAAADRVVDAEGAGLEGTTGEGDGVASRELPADDQRSDDPRLDRSDS